jgi:mannose-6-phosphate isomerase-like protein (cupin superfamily)
MGRLLAVLLLIEVGLMAQEHKVEPTWLYRDVAKLAAQRVDLSTDSCRYTPVFGEGDNEPNVPKSITRFGQLHVDPHGTCQTVAYPHTEELYFVRSGKGTLHYGDESHAFVQDDFTYLSPGVRHSVSNPSDQPLEIVVATVRIPSDIPIAQPSKLAVVNLSELKQQTVEGHPASVQYKLMIGPRTAKRDRINATYTVADFFLMDFAPGGTNTPHHHETAEEIYLVLDGEGQMAAGGGMDGIEGLHHAKAGDAYYFRQNSTVGFYNRNDSQAKAHILALRAFVPIPKNPE